MEKIDIEKLKRDVFKYENAGVPHEKMSFWLRVDEVFSTLESVATQNDEVHPLNALLSREHFSNILSDVSLEVPVLISAALERDQAPLPEVCKCTQI